MARNAPKRRSNLMHTLIRLGTSRKGKSIRLPSVSPSVSRFSKILSVLNFFSSGGHFFKSRGQGETSFLRCKLESRGRFFCVVNFQKKINISVARPCADRCAPTGRRRRRSKFSKIFEVVQITWECTAIPNFARRTRFRHRKHNLEPNLRGTLSL